MGWMRRYFFPEIDSTQTLLRAWAEKEDLPDGTLVYALHQRAGYGRHGAAWFSTPGESLTFSFLLQGGMHPTTLPIRVALALYDTVIPYARQPIFLKWPNDLWTLPEPLGKLAGILSELRWEGAKLRYAIIGIGLNVYQRSFPPELAAASLAQIGTPPSLDALLNAFEEALFYWRKVPDETTRQTFLRRTWRVGCLLLPDRSTEAHLLAWDNEDNLHFETPTGTLRLPAALATDIWKPILSA